MPQHSLGASSRACATMRSSMERAIRMGRPTLAAASATTGPEALGALGGLQRLDLVVGLVVGLAAVVDGVLELAHPVADRLAHLGQALRPEDDQGDHQDDDELHRTDVWHCLVCFPRLTGASSVPRDA